MDSYKLQYFKSRLEEEKSRLTNALNLMNENSESSQDKSVAGELSNYDNHPADIASEVFQVSMNNTLKTNEQSNIYRIDEALNKIEHGSYGICETCSKEIDFKRLEALPYANHCLDCEAAEELHYDSPTMSDNKFRPVEEDVIDNPFGRTKFNHKDPDEEHEGMDQLDTLMKYGSSDSPSDLGGIASYKEYYTNEVDKQGIVDPMDNISNEEYKKQIP